MVANVCDNVRLHHLQDCLHYRIQEERNCRRGCILMCGGFIFGGWGRGIGGEYIWLVGGSDAHFLCMLTSTCRWMCGENSMGGSSAVRQIKGVGWGCRLTYCRIVGELSNIHPGPINL